MGLMRSIRTLLRSVGQNPSIPGNLCPLFCEWSPWTCYSERDFCGMYLDGRTRTRL